MTLPKEKIDINEIQYIMVSRVSNWKSLATNGISNFFKKDLIDEFICRIPDMREAVTLFIQKNSDEKPDEYWIGKSFSFEKKYRGERLSSIHFKVREIKPTICPRLFKKHPIGWHRNLQHATANSHLNPPFLEEMATTDDWRLFEKYCHYLLKLLGINNLHMFNRGSNKGKADGQFVYNDDLYVIYDATLRDNFLEVKNAQIVTFAKKLKNSRTISFKERQFALKNMSKQIWIITRGNECKEIAINPPASGKIVIKEVPFQKLVQLYYTRFNEEISEAEFCRRLKNI